MCVQLVLLTCGTALNVFLYKLCKAWPPEFSSDKLTGFEITRVSNSLVVMVVSEDGVMERVL